MNPYRGKPPHQFWRSAVAEPAATEVDPVVATGFAIAPADRIATAGSCFAQHIARTLAASGYGYMVAEDAPATPFAEDENYGTFSARYGNIYTVRQLLQLFSRAYATFEPIEPVWRRPDGRVVDPFRPAIQAGGFADTAAMLAERKVHLAAVRTLFETCDVFVFTLGLTEAWVSASDGAVVPLAPGVLAVDVDPAAYRFHNFTVAEMDADLERFIRFLRGVNPAVRIVLTVSPVPLIATYEARHVLVSTTYSKAALRVVAEQAVRRGERVDYFPSYEMITGAHARGRFYAEDLREVLPEGVAYVMAAFRRHYLVAVAADREEWSTPAPSVQLQHAETARAAEVGAIICDEEVIGRAA